MQGRTRTGRARTPSLRVEREDGRAVGLLMRLGTSRRSAVLLGKAGDGGHLFVVCGSLRRGVGAGRCAATTTQVGACWGVCGCSSMA